MSITSNIRRIILISISVLAGAGFIVLLIAAVNSRNHQVCQGYEIEIKDADKAVFIDKKDVEKVLTANRTIVLKNKPVKSIDLNIIEARLKKESWIKDAEIFAYHTNYKGDYLNDAQGVAKIHGTAWSNESGAIRFITIYPRGYNDSPTGEHIPSAHLNRYRLTY